MGNFPLWIAATSVAAGGDVTVTPAALTLTVTLETPTIVGDVIAFPDTQVLKENYNTGDDSSGSMTVTSWRGMTWTTESAYTISSVRMKLYRGATPPANVFVEIRATDGSKPIGAALTSGSIDGSTLTQGSPGSFIEIPVTPYALSDATKYCIVLYPDTISFSVRLDNSSPTYTGGNAVTSANSGSSWTTQTYDLMFEVYGLSALELSVAVLDPTIVAGVIVTPSALTLTVSVLEPTVIGDVTVTPSAVVLTASVLAPTIAIVGDVTVTPSALTLTATLLAPTIKPDLTIIPSALSLTASVLASTIVSDVTVTPAVVAITASMLAPTINVGGSVTVTPTALSLSLTLTVPTFAGRTTGWPEARPLDYNPDLYWDEADAEWNSDRLTQPGAYTEYVLIFSEEGEIYFRAVV